MIVLAIESSCDETSVSINKDGTTILSNVVLSQIALHAKYGGVVPEIASREHVKGITAVFEESFEKAHIAPEDVDLVAVTEGPGLIGSLLIGINAAKAFALARNIPIIGVHHIAGHVYANAIEAPLEFPLICLVVSGGHTELLKMKSHYHFEKLGETKDDAIGEAYDKIARVLGIGYPGGPAIDERAQAYKKSDRYPMPRVSTDNPYDFSYSGLKSHVINMLNRMRMKGEPLDVDKMCASFQEAAVEHLIQKSLDAVKAVNAKMFLVAGGVAANSLLRARVQETFDFVKVAMPPFEYCTDNAAMIGVAGYYKYITHQKVDTLDMNGRSRLAIE